MNKSTIYERILPVPHGFRLVKIENNVAYYIENRRIEDDIEIKKHQDGEK